MEIWLGIAVLVIVVGVAVYLFSRRKHDGEREPRPDEPMDKFPPMSGGWDGGDGS
jgi:hypothetical protein